MQVHGGLQRLQRGQPPGQKGPDHAREHVAGSSLGHARVPGGIDPHRPLGGGHDGARPLEREPDAVLDGEGPRALDPVGSWTSATVTPRRRAISPGCGVRRRGPAAPLSVSRWPARAVRASASTTMGAARAPRAREPAPGPRPRARGRGPARPRPWRPPSSSTRAPRRARERAPGDIGERLRHVLEPERRDDGLLRGGNRGRDQPGAASERRPRGEGRGAGLAQRAGHHEEMAVDALVGVHGARCEASAEVGSLQEEGPRSPRDLGGRDTDRHHHDLTGPGGGRMQQERALVAGERRGEGGAHGGAEQRAPVRRQAGGQIEGDHRTLGRPPLQPRDHLRHQAARGALRTGAQEGVHHEVGVRQGAVDRVEVRAPAVSSTRPFQRASALAASPRTSARRPTRNTRTRAPATRSRRATTKPSPPLLPLPQSDHDDAAAHGAGRGRRDARGAGAGAPP